MPTVRPPVALRLHCDRSAPRLATAWLRENAPATGLSGAPLSRAEVCLDELVTNVVRHSGTPAPTGLTITLERAQGELHLRIEDDGRPFDPTGTAPPQFPRTLGEAAEGGRGIYLARTFADEMRYERSGSSNRVTLVFLDPVLESAGSIS